MAFDTRVHIRDVKSGAVKRVQPYRYVCDKERGSWFERDGNRYAANGDLLGPVGEAGPQLIKAAAPVVAQRGADSAGVQSEATFPSHKETRK